MVHFSASQLGFFDDACGPLPPDAVAITEAAHAALCAAQGEGKRISADTAGRPVILDAVSVTAPAVCYLPRWKCRRYLATLDPRSEGPLAAFVGATLMSQIDQFAAANLDPASWEKYDGSQEWRSDDALLLSLLEAIGLGEVAALFDAAAALSG